MSKTKLRWNWGRLHRNVECPVQVEEKEVKSGAYILEIHSVNKFFIKYNSEWCKHPGKLKTISLGRVSFGLFVGRNI